MCTHVLSTRCFILKLNFVNYQNVVLLVNIVGMESKNGRCVICICFFFQFMNGTSFRPTSFIRRYVEYKRSRLLAMILELTKKVLNMLGLRCHGTVYKADCHACIR